MKSKVARLLRLLIPIAVIFSLWLPPVAHYCVFVTAADRTTVEKLRRVPVDSRLREIEEQALFIPLRFRDNEVLQAAERLVTGSLLLPGYPTVPVSPRFDNADLIKGLPTWGLQYGSLVVPEIFLKAYEISGNPKWLTAALDFTTAFIRYEKSAWLPEGFLWNDHAIAGRVGVIIKLWRLYRNSQDYSEQIGQELIGHILRCRALLGKKSHFTFSTNHGVMQNISLLQIRAAFPSLPEEKFYLALAIERLDKQLRFYISDEGVVLEHSAEYHKIGFQLIGMAVRLLELLGEPVPQRWKELHKKSRDFLEVIALPDGGLPLFGNTSSRSELMRDFSDHSTLSAKKSPCNPDEGWRLYPVSGYAILWSCDPEPSQTVMALSFFQGHGHKHADELSILTWAHDRRWLTGVGYWPYGVQGDEITYGWGGSNAPHWIGEQTNGERSSTIVSFATSNQLSFLDARRDNVDGSGFRRQLIQLGSELWVVLDMPYGSKGKDAEILWTFFPGVSLTPEGGQDYRAVSGGSAMWVNISGGAIIQDRLLSGERSPWLGWVVDNGVPSPADTLRLQFSGSQQMPVVSTLHLRRVDDAGAPVKLHLTHYQSPDDWEFTLKIGNKGTTQSVRLVNDQISVSGPQGGTQESLRVNKMVDVGVDRKAIETAYQETAKEYPRYREVSNYRLRLTKIFLALIVINELLLLLVWVNWRRMFHVLQLASVGGWITLGILSHLWYFS